MQPKLEKIPANILSSIAVKKEVTPFMDYPWHYHPEFEIIFVEESYGIRLMGNHIGNFSHYDLMFISPNLPHVWRNDPDFYQGRKDLKVVVYVIQFLASSLGEDFFALPEFAQIRDLFERGQQGILIKGNSIKKISKLIKKVYLSSGITRLVYFLKTLDAFANAEEYELLSIPGYINSNPIQYTEKINKAVSYLMENFNKDINTQEVAKLVNMNESSFCRYFKTQTHKTCSRFLNEIRIAHACKLLVNTRMTATQVCYEIGYNNISYFNRQFKLITGLTAKAYARKYLNSVY